MRHFAYYVQRLTLYMSEAKGSATAAPKYKYGCGHLQRRVILENHFLPQRITK